MDMVKAMAKRYETSDFVKLGGTVKMDTETDYVNNTEGLVLIKDEEPKGKSVFGCQADNCRLPFPDEVFDAYVSNLSMMIVHDYKKQISECYRVLQSGSKACFSVWGRPENSFQFTVMKRACEKLGRPAPDHGNHTEFHLNFKQAEIMECLQKTGFKDCKMWH